MTKPLFSDVRKRLAASVKYHDEREKEAGNNYYDPCHRRTDTDISRLLAALDLAVEALDGRHDGCNYLAYGVCNKCGKLVNSEALAAIRAISEGEGYERD